MINENTATKEINTPAEGFNELYEVVKKLRSPEGCPWDREQTPMSMRGDLIEECFEAVDAINQNDAKHIQEELGDVFLNATMIAYMHEQKGDFFVKDVLDDVVKKIIRRHPHVWKDSEGCINANEKKATTSEEVLTQWDNIKRGIENRKEKSVLDEVSTGLPPLMRSYKIQKKASKKGFEWNDTVDVWKKVYEELEEVKEAIENNEGDVRIEEELGDVLFAIVHLCARLKVDPSLALTRCTEKFKKRFSYVESQCQKNSIPMDSEHLRQMDEFWNQAKKIEK